MAPKQQMCGHDLFIRGELPEILRSLGTYVLLELHGDTTERSTLTIAAELHVKVDDRVGLVMLIVTERQP
jgi:hypothetical protein